VQIARGRYQKHKVVHLARMSREAAFNKLTEAISKGFTVKAAMKPSHGPRAT
jgi:hypothetical protein